MAASSATASARSAVTGSATLEASGDALAVTAASFEADLSQLESDEGRRDNRIRSIGLESDTYPTATFVLTEALEVPAEALTGATVDVTLTGELTIHGVTKSVSIPAQARLNGDRIEVVGALTFPFSDFDMTPPDVAGFVQVEDDATLELLISLAKA
jgi:polyisoprenoid-binding protein YceI